MMTFAISSFSETLGWSAYYFVLSEFNQATARDYCEETWGAHPIRIETIEEYNNITAILNANASKN